jgi:hypothetical protein
MFDEEDEIEIPYSRMNRGLPLDTHSQSFPTASLVNPPREEKPFKFPWIEAGVGALAFAAILRSTDDRKAKKMPAHGEKDTEREVIYLTAMRCLDDPGKLRALADKMASLGLTAPKHTGLDDWADMLRKRAALKELPDAVKAQRKAAFQKGMKSANKAGVLKLADMFRHTGAFGAADKLESHANGLPDAPVHVPAASDAAMHGSRGESEFSGASDMHEVGDGEGRGRYGAALSEETGDQIGEVFSSGQAFFEGRRSHRHSAHHASAARHATPHHRPDQPTSQQTDMSPPDGGGSASGGSDGSGDTPQINVTVDGGGDADMGAEHFYMRGPGAMHAGPAASLHAPGPMRLSPFAHAPQLPMAPAHSAVAPGLHAPGPMRLSPFAHAPQLPMAPAHSAVAPGLHAPVTTRVPAAPHVASHVPVAPHTGMAPHAPMAPMGHAGGIAPPSLTGPHMMPVAPSVGPRPAPPNPSGFTPRPPPPVSYDGWGGFEGMGALGTRGIGRRRYADDMFPDLTIAPPNASGYDPSSYGGYSPPVTVVDDSSSDGTLSTSTSSATDALSTAVQAAQAAASEAASAASQASTAASTSESAAQESTSEATSQSADDGTATVSGDAGVDPLTRQSLGHKRANGDYVAGARPVRQGMMRG